MLFGVSAATAMKGVQGIVRTSVGRQSVLSLDKSKISGDRGFTPHNKAREDYIHLSADYRIKR
jgi:hypothetical protein